jgi:tellurite resistance protein TerC
MLPFESIASPLTWLGFVVFVLVLLAVDLGVFHRRPHAVGAKEAAIWSGVWVGLALLFNAGIWLWSGPERALEFTAGYLIEKALAVDNLFVFVVIFSAFGIPALYQHRVLFWGVLGALLMRALFILIGGALLAHFHWMLYVFGAVLVVTGVKLLLQRDAPPHPERNPVVMWFQRIVPFTPKLSGDRFTVLQQGRRYATPLLLALVAVEVSDLIFAIDSIPAIFAVTSDPFIVFTSNIFAILGLRSMYFLLAGVLEKFKYLQVGLACVLMFVGAKMLLADLFPLPVLASLGIIAGILGASIALSLLRAPRRPQRPRRPREQVAHAPGAAPALRQK